jgi:tRNA dimethylallyltransferase
LRKELALEKAVENIKKETRNFAKRQLTWFKKVSSAKWIEVDVEKPEMTDEAIYTAVQEHFNF